MSFTNQTLVGAAAANPQYVGLDNYTDLFNSANWMRRGEFGASLLLTAEFVIGSALIGQAGLGLLLATLFHNRKGILRETIFTLAITAWIIPDVVVAFAWFAYLDPGWHAQTHLADLGPAPPRLACSTTRCMSVILSIVCAAQPFRCCALLVGAGVNSPSQLETADDDRRERLGQKFRDILLPQLGRYILTDMLLITLWNVQHLYALPADRRRPGPQDRRRFDLHLPARLEILRVRQRQRGRRRRTRSSTCCLPKLPDRQPLAEERMRPLTRLLLLLVVTVLGLFFVLPRSGSSLRLSTTTPPCVTLPSALSLANFQEVLDNDLAMRGLPAKQHHHWSGYDLATTAAAALAA